MLVTAGQLVGTMGRVAGCQMRRSSVFAVSFPLHPDGLLSNYGPASQSTVWQMAIAGAELQTYLSSRKK